MAFPLIQQLREQLRVYFIMGSNNCPKDPLEVLREAIAGGITLFQFREKGKGALEGRQKYELAKSLQAICRENHIPFLVNDDVQLAIELDADGMHIGQEDEPANRVRQKIGKDKILGVSAHTLEEVRLAIAQGADYLGCGPMFPTSTKEDAKAVQGVSWIQTIRDQGIEIPLVGIGGITENNAASVIRAGADGVSVISAISQATSISEAAKNIKFEVTKAIDA